MSPEGCFEEKMHKLGPRTWLHSALGPGLGLVWFSLGQERVAGLETVLLGIRSPAQAPPCRTLAPPFCSVSAALY